MANEKAVALPVDVAMQEQERLTLLAAYHPHEHLMEWLAFDKVLNRRVPVIYYPAAWRLYELNLRYPNANFDTEIVHMDLAKDFVIIKARLYLGVSYDASIKRASAFKQGKLSELDRVETKAKARAARDFGIGTEHALDMDDAEATSIGSEPSANGRTVVEAVNENDRTQRPQPQLVQSTQAAPQVVESAPAEKPTSASLLPKYTGMADLYYPGGWSALAMKVAKDAQVIGAISDEQLLDEYLVDVQAALKACAKKQPAKTA